MQKEQIDQLIQDAQKVVEQAQKGGAQIAEVMARKSRELNVRVRMGQPELVEEAGSHALGLRVLKDGRSATCYTSDTTEAGLKTLVEDALELAVLSEPDPYSEPPNPEDLVKDYPDLDLYDEGAESLDAAKAIEMALEGENAALEYDAAITNSKGASVSRTLSAVAMVTSGGFSGGYRGSYQSVVVQPLADDADKKKRVGFHWDARRYLSALDNPAEVGKEAARRTLEKLGAQKIDTAEIPVIFTPDSGRALLSLLFSCLSGTAIYERRSYLLDKEGETIAAPGITIVDNPLIPRGPGSRPFDGDGLASRENLVVDSGTLKTYLCDTYSARKLDRKSTGSASRGVGGRPSVSPTNFHLLPGDKSPDELLQGVERGLYVTSMMGSGFNPITGDFSRGAEGFLIEKGKKTTPVAEVTISLNFDQLWKSIDAVANELDPKASLATPAFRVSKMTVAGS